MMEMTDLISAINKVEKPLLVRITKVTYELVNEPGNNRLVDVNDFCNVLHNKEDAMATLFDADIFGWNIRSVDWCNSSCSNGVPWMELEVTLFKTN